MAQPITADTLNQITSTIIAAAIKVHRALGPGLLENAYLPCLCCELNTAHVQFEVQKSLPLVYRGIRIDCVYRADLIVEGTILVEVKAMEELATIHTRQLNTYLRLAECPVGLLLNFGAPTMREGIKRVVHKISQLGLLSSGIEAVRRAAVASACYAGRPGERPSHS